MSTITQFESSKCECYQKESKLQLYQIQEHLLADDTFYFWSALQDKKRKSHGQIHVEHMKFCMTVLFYLFKI